LKPENILFGLHPYSDTLHIIDFGLAKQYRDPHTHIHNKYRTDLSPIGTARYASINAQSGFELSRRDDLESLSYILIYFLRGSLPWQDLPGSTKMKQGLMLQMKKTITPHILCQGLPVEFELILKHARKLRFEQRPNYQYLHGLVRQLLSKQEYSTADWEVAKVWLLLLSCFFC
jgi:serine/threonine protein kinase